MGEAKLIKRLQGLSRTGLCIKGVIWEIRNDPNYANGVKYRLVVFEPSTKKVLLLFDNHYPKGDHYHFEEKINQYEFISIDYLIRDLISMVSEMEEKYENKKNNY